jgi:hypothetical protein
MDNSNDVSTEIVAEEGMTAFHPDRDQSGMLVAPSVGSEFNTLGLDLIPVACLSLADVAFEFDSSFVLPGAAKVLAKLPMLRKKRADKNAQLPPLSVFGHADPTGSDEYNKQLSGRRALAVYGLLCHDVTIWNDLYNRPLGGDNWRSKSIAQTMQTATGSPQGTSFSSMVDAYMTAVYPTPLTPQDFLAQGADSEGKGDYQGCGEFNPLLLLSISDQQTLPKEERDARNRSNRRVVVYLFRPGTTVVARLWPCPRAKEGPARCHDRFFSNGDARRAQGATQREHATLAGTPQDTFACRFYSRVGGKSPCETPLKAQPITIRLFDPFTVGIPDVPYQITVGGQVFEQKADPDGFVHLKVAEVPEDCLVQWGHNDEDNDTASYTYSMKIYLQLNDPDEDEEIRRRLHNLGYTSDDELTDKVTAFQIDYGLKQTGDPADIKTLLRSWYNDPTEVRKRPDSA